MNAKTQELRKLKRRVKRLENCLTSLCRILSDADAELTSQGVDILDPENSEARLVLTLQRRIFRTFNPYMERKRK